MQSFWLNQKSIKKLFSWKQILYASLCITARVCFYYQNTAKCEPKRLSWADELQNTNQISQFASSKINEIFGQNITVSPKIFQIALKTKSYRRKTKTAHISDQNSPWSKQRSSVKTTFTTFSQKISNHFDCCIEAIRQFMCSVPWIFFHPI